MATDELLPPACAFAISVLAERDQDPDAVPEEAVEAAQQHMATCRRCLSNPPLGIPRKKKKVRRVAKSDSPSQTLVPSPLDEAAVFRTVQVIEPVIQTPQQSLPPPEAVSPPASAAPPATPKSAPAKPAIPATPADLLPALISEDGPMDCLQCRQLLPEYAEAIDSGQNVALLYPAVQEHLLSCETGCLVLLDLFRQEAKANRKYRRRPVRNPFSAIWWEISGFFRGGQISMSPKALSYGTLLLLLLIGSLSTYLAIRWDDARFYHPPKQKRTIPTPDGIGLSDGLKVFDACNASSYQYKRDAVKALQSNNFSKADSLLSSATSTVATDTTGCNGAEAAIYREDLSVRQSGRPFGIIIVSFDSGPGDADPQGGTDRHILYAAYTQELVGAFIAQQQYNSTQMQTPGAPLLYLVLANTAGVEQGALQIANSVASLSATPPLEQLHLVAQGKHPLLAVLGLGPSSLAQVVLPVLCRAGIPLIIPTATGLFIIDLISQTSLYRHCTPGFAFIRFSPDDAHQSELASNYAYDQLQVRNVAIFYDPSNPSSQGSAQAFLATFTQRRDARIVAQETAVASGLLDTNGQPQASRDDLLAGLKDALQAKPRPDLIFAPLLTNDVITLAEALARLPKDQQPTLMIGGEFVQARALKELVRWSLKEKLSLPPIFVSISTAARQDNQDDWQKQFYASFCTSFTPPGIDCSGPAAIDQGGLLFADGIEMVAKALGPITQESQIPTPAQLVKTISQEKFAGVSCPIALRFWNNVLITSTKALPVILGLQEDGSIRIVG